MPPRIIAALVTVAALATACGEPRSASPGAPDDPVVSTPGGDTGGRAGAEPVRPRPGMVDLRAARFVRYRVRSGDERLTLYFYSGVAPCYVLDHVDLAYGRRAVRVALFVGRDPDGGDRSCPEIARLYRVDVPLREPLEGRRVVNARAPSG